MTDAAETWEPGIPLYDKNHHPHSLYVFNFRDDPEHERCSCPDRAAWPEPGPGKRLPEVDELAEFIAEHRVWRARPQPPTEAT